MKTKSLIILSYATLILTSCSPCVSEQPKHEIESVSELIDSMLYREQCTPFRYIYCYKDTLCDSYHIIASCRDTMGVDTLDVDAWYKRLLANIPPKSVRDTENFCSDPDYMRKIVSNYKFMIHNATQLIEKLCKTGEESYRYCGKDSVNYSVTISSQPKRLLYASRFTNANGWNQFGIQFSQYKQVKVTSKPNDRTPVQQLIKKFIAEHKNVVQFDVCYDLDEGAPIPKEVTRVYMRGGDSLAASHVTGTHYIISVEKGKKGKVFEDFSNRMLHMMEEQPVPGSRLHLNICDKQQTKNKEKYYKMYSYEIGLFSYQVLVEEWNNEVHIFELDLHDSKRVAIPFTYTRVKSYHNSDIICY